MDTGFQWVQMGVWVVTAAGVIYSIWATEHARRRQAAKDDETAKQVARDAERAEKALKQERAAAERAEAAAGLTIDTLTRISDSLNQIAASGLGTGIAPRGVAWELTNQKNSSYLLQNIGDATAYDVRIETHESLSLGGDLTRNELAPTEGVAFYSMATLGTSDYTITVRWKDNPDSEDHRTWRFPLPPEKG